MNSPHNELISRHKRDQESVARAVTIILMPIFNTGRFLWRFGRIEGLIFGIRRAYWRCRIHSLGPYSDIAQGVIVKTPQSLSIGERSCVNAHSFIDAGGGVSIGNFVQISHHVSINSQTHTTVPPYHGLVRSSTKIEDGAWIGAKVVILEGVTIGRCAIIGAGSVVKTNVPPYSIFAGVPAREIGQISDRISF